MEFEIFIKDNAFIPDIVDIKTNTTVIFRNEDSVQHTIHCNGCTNFVPLFVKAGKPERYVFSTRGKYLISDAGFGDMKCVVEATDMERENIPKRNYFLTSKEKKMLEEQELVQKAATPTPIAMPDEESPIFHSSSSLFADMDENGVSARQLEEYRSSTSTRNGPGRPTRHSERQGQANSSSDSEDSEYNSLSQQRTKFKQSTSKLSAAGHSVRGDSGRTGKPGVPAKPKATKDDSGTAHTKRPAFATPVLTIPTKENLVSKPTVTDLPAKVVLIEDFAFQFEVVEVVVGQPVEFRLTQLVPAHAEHELCGTSTIKALNFVSPLLQRDECSSFTFCPSVPGEISVVCQVEKDMCCKIIVAAQSSLDTVAHRPPLAADILPSTPNSRVLSPPPPAKATVLPTSKAAQYASSSEDIASAPPSPELRSLAVTATRSLSPSSPAMQDVRTALLQLESRDSRAELSESQSSFYDSDDIFSDFEAPANLQSTYNSLTPNRKKNMEYGVPKREASAPTERLRPAEMLTSPGRTVAHVVSLEEFTFRPNHLVIRCGDCVRFRRSSSQPAASLVCEGQFSDGAVNIPCALSTILAPGDPLAEERYFCFDHVFHREGSFEVQNEIYSFSKCNVIVVPVTTPPEASRNNPANNARKGPAPKLMGSFSSATSIAQPVFHKPIDVPTDTAAGSVSHNGIPSPPDAWRAPPTTTTVNASTTTVSTTFSSSTSSSTLPAALTTTTNRKSSELPQLSPRALPLFGSFQNLSHTRTSPLSAAASTGPVLPTLEESQELDERAQSDSEGGEGGDEDAATIRKKEKQREKQRRKRDKMKLKLKNKREAAAQELLESELRPLLAAEGGSDEDAQQKSPEAVISKYLTDSTKFRDYIAAQADYGEEIEFADDSDQEAALQQQEEVPAQDIPVIAWPPSSVVIVQQVSTNGRDEAVVAEIAKKSAISESLNGEADHVESTECVPPSEVMPSPFSTPAADSATKRKRNRSRTKSASKMDLSARFASVDDSPGQVKESTASAAAHVVTAEEPLPLQTASSVGPAVIAMKAPPASEPTQETTNHSEPAAAQDEFATPVKHRRRGSRTKLNAAPLTADAGDSFHTPPSRMPPAGNKAASTTARSANLLRAVLRISPLSDEKEVDTPNSNLFCTPEQYTPVVVRTASPATHTASAEESRLSMLVAYEQQMEEFLLSRFEAIDAMIERSIKDRLPSGKAVEVLYLRDVPEEHFDSVGGKRRTPAVTSTGQSAAHSVGAAPTQGGTAAAGKSPAPAKAVNKAAVDSGGSANKKSPAAKGKREAQPLIEDRAVC